MANDNRDKALIVNPPPPGFDSLPAEAKQALEQSGVVSAIAREEAELKAAIVLARHFPRDEAVAVARLLRSCQRPNFAETVAYRFPRGGTIVEGPSVDLAREAARCWGNIRYGLRIVSADDNWIQVMGMALDLESNQAVQMEDRFRRLIQRKDRGWVVPDERDTRELVNRRGAICVRNAILQLLPPDAIEEAMRLAKATVAQAASGKGVKQTLEEAQRRLVLAFSEYAVTGAMIAAHLGHAVDDMSPDEIADLRQIYQALKDGVAKRDEFFEVAIRETGDASSSEHAATATAVRQAELREKLAKKRQLGETGRTSELHTGGASISQGQTLTSPTSIDTPPATPPKQGPQEVPPSKPVIPPARQVSLSFSGPGALMNWVTERGKTRPAWKGKVVANVFTAVGDSLDCDIGSWADIEAQGRTLNDIGPILLKAWGE